MRHKPRLLKVLRVTASEWMENNAPQLGAAVAYYALFSVIPIIIIALAIAAEIFGAEAARGELRERLQVYFGKYGAEAIQAMLGSAEQNRKSGTLAIIISSVILFFGASSVFTELKDSLNKIWEVREKKRTGIIGILWDRMLAVIMVIIIGALLMVSLFASAVISKVVELSSPVITVAPEILHMSHLAISFALLTLLFAVIFKLLPDVKIGWRNVFLGATFTSVLFALGKFVIGFYIAKGAMSSSYGAAGSVVVIMLWIYYSTLIFLFGAEFTYVYTKLNRLPVEPLPIAEDDPNARHHKPKASA